jgi:putative ABC transport system ATP-binding protein
VIEVEGLQKSYRRDGVPVPVLTGVSFAVRAGEFVAIMGPSGSGKTTLLNLLGFLDTPDAGVYRFEGSDLSAAGEDKLAAVRNRRIGFVFQQFHLLERVSATENVMLPLLYAEEEAADGEARAERALDAVGLGHRKSHRAAELSGGEQQRVAIARALINDPALILADEPTGNLDEQSGGEILDILERLRDAGRTVILVTHDPAVARRAGRVLRLERGGLRPDGSK